MRSSATVGNQAKGPAGQVPGHARECVSGLVGRTAESPRCFIACLTERKEENEMKRRCKNVSIFDRALIERAVRACMQPGKKRRRRDTVAFFADLMDCRLDEAREFLVARDGRYDKAVERVVELGLSIKPGWRVFRVGRKNEAGGQPVDMMGFRFFRNVVTVRRRIFRRGRRALLRVLRCVRERRQVPVSLARRCVTYKGYFDFSDCARFLAAVRARFVFRVAAMRVYLAERMI